jgi:ribosome-binding ATPase YchF (GTP1/OBG family)
MEFSDDDKIIVKQMNLLTNKPVIKILNVDEDKIVPRPGFVVVSAQLESELGDEVKDLGVAETGLEKLIAAAYDVLGLQSFLTAGELEARAWTIRRGSTALMASGAIHNDFIKHFIKADIINWQEFVDAGGWSKARELGKVRSEGRDYVMQEGDVVEFKIGN